MTKKVKLIFLLIFIILLLAVYFLLWRNKIFAPHTILIQNSGDEAIDTADSPPAGGLSATDSVTILPPENITKNTEPIQNITEPKENNAPAKELPTVSHQLSVTQKLISWGFSTASNRKIDTIIIHSSYNALGGDEYSVEKLIAEYKEYGVAPHYLIDRQGKIYQLVADKNIAYHTGESKVPDGRTGVNNFSLGIEMMNTQEDKYTSEQYTSLNFLIAKIKSTYSIKYTLGHNDISPDRKTDPWNFDWKKIK